MRAWLVVVVPALGCNAIIGAHDFPVPPDAASDAVIGDASAASCGGTVWRADFSTDPTLLDDNGDGKPDWTSRGGGAFPTMQLVGGVWRSPSTAVPLDTNPVQDFTTRTLVHARMRGTDSDGGLLGAVAWVNVGYDAMGSYAPVFVDIRLGTDGAQTVSLHTKNAGGAVVTLAAQHVPTQELLDVTLDIDPANLRVTFASSAFEGVYDLARLPPNSTREGFASVLGYDTSAEIDDIAIEVCPD